MIDAAVFRQLHDTIQSAARARHALTLSEADVQVLSTYIDELIRVDVEAYLLETQNPAADAADEQAFVRAASAALWAQDDSADSSVYDDL